MTDRATKTKAGDDDEISIDRIRQMDDEATNSTHWKILLTAGMGFFTDAYDLFVIGVVGSILATEWDVTSFQKSLLSSVALLTSAFGAVIFGRIADKLGRKKIYGWEVIILAAGAIASALSPNIWWLLAFRAILGVGIGGDYPVSATIMSEYASKKNRGRMVSLVFAMQGLGLVVGPAIAIGLLATGMSHDLVWRLLLGFGAIPGLAVFYLRRTIAETPRFRLAQQEEKKREKEAADSGARTGIRGVLADKRILKWLIGASAAWFLFDFVYYGNTISSQLIVAKVAPHAGLIGQIADTLLIFSIAALPAYLLAAATIDHLGRKLIQTFGFFAIALAFFLMWAIPAATTSVALFLVLFGATYFFSEFGPNTTTFVYPAEIFPVHVRTTSHGIAAASGKIGAFVGTYTLTYLLGMTGLPRVAVLVAAVAAVGGVVTLVLLPEPKGKSLEELTDGDREPTSAVVLGMAQSRATRPPRP